jgi:hypothetical protein
MARGLLILDPGRNEKCVPRTALTSIPYYFGSDRETRYHTIKESRRKNETLPILNY